MAYNVISRQKVAENSQSLKIAKYGIFWIIPGESSCPDGSEYVWQRGVESLQGRVTAARS